MGSFKKALSDAEVLKCNVRNFDSWLKAHRKLVTAGVNKSIFYAGGEYDVNLKAVEDEIAKKKKTEKINTQIFETIKKLQSVKSGAIPFEYETVEDVATKIRSHPTLIDRDQVEKTFAHLYEYMECLGKLPKLFPTKSIKPCWSALSEAYAENAKGHVKILDGVDEDYKMIDKQKILLKTELLALLNNKNLSEEAKKILDTKVGKYVKYLDAEVKETVKSVLNSRNNLK